MRVTRIDPFYDSLADSPFDQPGTPISQSTVEPWMAVNPLHPNNIVIAQQQDRWTPPYGGARGLTLSVSMDGGKTWRPSLVPGITLTSGGLFERASDPWVSFAPNGDLYHASLSFDVSTGENAILVNRSRDGGLTWSAPYTLIENDKTKFNDKESITADPTNAHLAYCIWDREGVPMFARTTDGGASWERARALDTGGWSHWSVGNQIVVQPNGILVDFFSNYIGSTLTASLLVSTDHGLTWSTSPFLAARQKPVQIRDFVRGEHLRAGDGLYPPAVDPNNGNLYIVWQDGRFSNGKIDEIAFSQSTDGGQTWSPPIKINKTPIDLPPGNRQAFLPALAVAADGTIAVTYYDFRRTDPATRHALLTDCWMVFCKPSASTPATTPANWGEEMRLTEEPFDFGLAPMTSGGRFLGDYTALQAIGNDFLAGFPLTDPTFPSATYVRRIYAPPP